MHRDRTTIRGLRRIVMDCLRSGSAWAYADLAAQAKKSLLPDNDFFAKLNAALTGLVAQGEITAKVCDNHKTYINLK